MNGDPVVCGPPATICNASGVKTRWLPQVVLNKTWQRMHGNEDGETGVEDDVAAQGFQGTAFSLNWLENSGPAEGGREYHLAT